MKAGDTASECVLIANGDEKKEKDESPRDLYIFCKDESGLFTELDSKLSVPLMPEWEEYFICELKDRKILKRLNVFSTNTEFAAYAVTLSARILRRKYRQHSSLFSIPPRKASARSLTK